MVIYKCSYFFTATGNRGGLYSVTLGMLPGDGGRHVMKNKASLKKAMREEFEVLQKIMEEKLYAQNEVRFDRMPVFTNSPNRSVGGYEYNGMVQPVPTIDKFLSNGQRLKLQCEFSKYSLDKPAQIELDFCLGHTSNIAFAEAVLALLDVKIHSEANKEVEQLNRLIRAPVTSQEGLAQMMSDD